MYDIQIFNKMLTRSAEQKKGVAYVGCGLLELQALNWNTGLELKDPEWLPHDEKTPHMG